VAAKEAILRVKVGQSLALVRGQDAFEQRTPLSIKIL